MKKTLLLALIFINTQAISLSGTIEVLAINNVYDGNTFRAYIKNIHPLTEDNIKIRLRGINAPEINGECLHEKKLAIKARDFIRVELYKSHKVILKDIGRGENYKIVAEVVVDGKSLNQMLVKKGLAHSYWGGKKKSWCKNN